MLRILVASLIVASTLAACTCDGASGLFGSEPTQPTVEAPRPDDKADETPRKTAVEIKREALIAELAEHKDVAYAMPARSVPDWFFRPTTELRRFLPEGEPYAWEAQFDCSSSNAPACNLNYEVKTRDVADAAGAYERAMGLSELGFEVVDERPPSLKAVRPVERTRAIEVVYLNQPAERDVWMSATLREPVHPEIARMLAQARFETLAGFSVEFVRVPYSLTVEKPAFEEEVAYSATYDLPEKLRGDVESYLRDHGFELETRGAVEAKTSVWTSANGWRVSLEGDESSYNRFMVYFSASGYVGADRGADEDE